ncbi:hypothetical protein CEQ21_21725 [Niallia circulans]|uniref:RNA polymerase sigma factor 70 region 4 type 2 domain-containing protein n=1 Tax=Niallia circulans TaxID=1397 RepID=A0A553SM12_NIACI|nr:sigma factor-like helix-turn-helix DNA-binding protein [Niallia circulans]TRZ38035.1 hypothetical protein CEQ21_21725 [Niallia circulans]
MSKQPLENDNSLHKHYESLSKYCQYLAMTKWEKEDIIHDTFLKAMESYQDSEITVSLLKKMVHNRWVDTIRKDKQEKAHLSATEAVQADRAADWMIVAEHLAESLTKKQAAVFLLVEGFGYRIKEAAEALEMTETGIKAILFRARNQLHKQHNDTKDNAGTSDASRLYYKTLKQQNPALLINEILSVQVLYPANGSRTELKRQSTGPIMQLAA